MDQSTRLRTWVLRRFESSLGYFKIMKILKTYLLIKEFMDVGHAVNTTGHAVLMGHLKWSGDPVYEDWLKNHFRKVTCKVNDAEFEHAKKYDDYVVVTEMAFDKAEVALIFKPRAEWPKCFKFYRLYN